MFADIIVDISHEKLDRTFQYRIPEKMEGRIQPGTVVRVPFGKGNRLTLGYVIALKDTAEYPVERMKEIAEVRTGEETTESRLIALAAWMRERYGSTMIQALKTVIPAKEKVRSVEKRSLHLAVSREECQEIIEELKKKNHRARLRVMEALLEQPVLDYQTQVRPMGITRAVLKPLEEKGWVRLEQQTVFRNPVDYSRKKEPPAMLSATQRQVADAIEKGWKRETGDPV